MNHDYTKLDLVELWVCNNCGTEIYEQIPGEFGSQTTHMVTDSGGYRYACGLYLPWRPVQKRLI